MTVNYLFFLASQLLLELGCSLESVEIGVFVYECLFFRMDVEANAFQGEIASYAVRQRQGVWGRTYGRG